MRLCGAAVLFSILCFGQSAGDATLFGKITDAATHQPIEGAMISYRGGRGGHGAGTSSDAQGLYTLRIPSGQSQGMTITRTGYSTVDSASGDDATVRLKPGESKVRDFEISKPASLRGHLLDRDSEEPLVGFYITAVRGYAQREGSTGYRYPGAPTDEKGLFSIANLPPGSYVLLIDPPQSGKVSSPDKNKKPRESTGYAPRWYPDVPHPDMAVPVLLNYGESRQMELRLRKRELLHIEGTITAPKEAQGDPVWISVLNAADSGRPAGISGEISKPGPFRIDGLEAGSYRIFAATRMGRGKSLFASREATLTSDGLDNLKMELRTGVSLKVDLAMDEKDSAPPERRAFIAGSLDGWTLESGTCDSFSCTGLPPGQYHITLMTVPGFAVTSMSLNGQSMPRESAVDLELPESVVTYVLTTHVGRVTGVVRDTDGNAFSDARVSLQSASEPEQRRGIGRQVEPDGNGRFAFDGLAPGRYRVSAGQTSVTVDVAADATAQAEIVAR